MPTPVPPLYQPAQAAHMLGISRTSLRRYADQFAPMLPDYNHRPAKDRQLSAADVGMLAAILDEMNRQPEGTTRSQLYARLTTPGTPPPVPLTIPEIASRSTPGQAQEATREAAQGERSSSPAPLATTDAAGIVATVTEAAERLSAALTDQAAATREATAQAAQLEARREARESRAERLQWAMLAILTVATVAAVLLLAIR